MQPPCEYPYIRTLPLTLIGTFSLALPTVMALA